MIFKKTNMIVLAYIIASFISCSTTELMENENLAVDLELAEENDWIISGEILNHINTYRTEHNLNPLTVDSLYASAFAVQHTKYMIENQTVSHDYFYNRSEGLKGMGAEQVVENVAFGYSSGASVVNAWLNSETHRSSIEGNYSHIGFGVLKCPTENKFYFTTLLYN